VQDLPFKPQKLPSSGAFSMMFDRQWPSTRTGYHCGGRTLATHWAGGSLYRPGPRKGVPQTMVPENPTIVAISCLLGAKSPKADRGAQLAGRSHI
jgi:hypothetical protein